jgi:hypothetical protein
MGTKKKVTVNIDGRVWDAFKQVAWRSQLEAKQNLSVSQYLENMLAVKLVLRSEDEPEKSLSAAERVLRSERAEKEKVVMRRGDSYTDDEIRAANDRLMEKREAAAQLKLDEKRKGRNIKKDKIDQVRATVNFNPQPKKSGK